MTARIDPIRYETADAFKSALQAFKSIQPGRYTEVDAHGVIYARPPNGFLDNMQVKANPNGLVAKGVSSAFARVLELNRDHITLSMAKWLATYTIRDPDTLHSLCVRNARESVGRLMTETYLDPFKPPARENPVPRMKFTTSDGVEVEASQSLLENIEYFQRRAHFHESCATENIPITKATFEALVKYCMGKDIRYLPLKTLIELMAFAEYTHEDNLAKLVFYTLFYRIDDSNFEQFFPALIQMVSTMRFFENSLLPLGENLLLRLPAWGPRITALHVQPLLNSIDPWAQCILGYLYLHGVGVNQDGAKATDCFRQAGELPTAMALLGDFTGASEKKSPLGLIKLGESLEGIDPTIAFTRYILAASLGLHVAHQKLGDCYTRGIGCRTDFLLARNHYTSAACLGSRSAQILLAKAPTDDKFEALGWALKYKSNALLALDFATGKSVPKSFTEATKVFVSAPQHIDDLERMEGLHRLYSRLNLTLEERKNMQAVFGLFKQMAKRHDIGNYYLAWCYEMGFGVERDTSYAIKLYNKGGYPEPAERLIDQEARLAEERKQKEEADYRAYLDSDQHKRDEDRIYRMH